MLSKVHASVYSKNLYIKTLNFEVQASIGTSDDYKLEYQAVRFLNWFLVYETENVHFTEACKISTH